MQETGGGLVAVNFVIVKYCFTLDILCCVVIALNVHRVISKVLWKIDELRGILYVHWICPIAIGDPSEHSLVSDNINDEVFFFSSKNPFC